MDTNFENKINLLVESYLKDYEGGRDIDRVAGFDRPDKETLIEILNKIQRIVFPGFFKNRHLKVYTVRNDITMQIEDILFHLIKQIAIVLKFNPDTKDLTDIEVSQKAEDLAFEFMNKIPKIREYIDTDVQASYDGDPAAFNKEEIIFSYPGLYAIFVYRVAHELYALGIPLIPRIMTVRSQQNRNRHKPGRHNRKIFLHRPRNRHRNRRDMRNRRQRQNLPGRHLRRVVHTRRQEP